MVQCEMCGTETGSPTTAKIEGAELEVCDSCAGFGTEVKTADTSTTSTKYSTSSSGSSDGQSTTSTSGGQSSSSTTTHSGPDIFDDMDSLAADYPDQIREARESRGLSQEELAQDLNEKASLIRKLERGDMQPSDAVQSKLERELDISLSAGDDEAETEWDSEVSPSETTLGDVVKRRD